MAGTDKLQELDNKLAEFAEAVGIKVQEAYDQNAAAPTISGTSASNLTIQTGSRTFETQAGILWVVGQRLYASSIDGTKAMGGVVTAYAGTTLVLNVDYTLGSGNNNNWNITISGTPGQIGAQGPTPVISGTSASNITVGLGAKTFVTQAGISFAIGQALAIRSSDGTKEMYGAVTAYSGTSLNVNVAQIVGLGSANDWVITMTGSRGPATPYNNPKKYKFADAIGSSIISITRPATGTVASEANLSDCLLSVMFLVKTANETSTTILNPTTGDGPTFTGNNVARYLAKFCERYVEGNGVSPWRDPSDTNGLPVLLSRIQYRGQATVDDIYVSAGSVRTVFGDMDLVDSTPNHKVYKECYMEINNLMNFVPASLPPNGAQYFVNNVIIHFSVIFDYDQNGSPFSQDVTVNDIFF